MISFFLGLNNIPLYIHFLGREGEGEGYVDTLMCERHMDWLPLACPQPGIWPTTQACALTGN